MAIDTDFGLYPDVFGPVDALSKKLLGGRNVHMAANGVFQRTSRQFLKRMPGSLRTTGIFPSQRVKGALEELVERCMTEEGHGKTAYGIVLENVRGFGNSIWMTASRFYTSMWLRDAYLTLRFTGMSSLEHIAIERFGSWQRKNGHIPTEAYFPGVVKHYRDDETTLLFFLWGCETGYKNEQQLRMAWEFSNAHAANGKYTSPGGTRRTMIDAFEYPDQSCIAYNQGLYAVASIFAHQRGLCDSETMEKAIEEYQNLAKTTSTCHLPMSDTLPYLDPTAMFGEYLALTIFGRTLLGEDVVRKTFEAFERTKVGKHGYRVVMENGRRIPKERFIMGHGDDYQTAKVPLLINMALSVFEMHGLVDDSYKKENTEWLDRIAWAEYENVVGMYHSGDRNDYIDPAKRRHAWNVYILKMHRDTETFLAKAA